jgi:hypothetical protein
MCNNILENVENMSAHCGNNIIMKKQVERKSVATLLAI